MLLNILIYLHRFIYHNTSSTSYKYSPIFINTNYTIQNMSSTYKNVGKLPLKCHIHMRPRNLHIAPTQDMSSTHNAKETIYLSSHSVLCKTCLLDILDNSKILWSYIKTRIQLRDTSIHTVFKNLPAVPITTLLKTNFKKTQFWQLNLLVNYLMDSSIATYRSQLLNLSKHPLWQIELYVFLSSFISSL